VSITTGFINPASKNFVCCTLATLQELRPIPNTTSVVGVGLRQLVEKEDGVKRLVLGARRYIMPAGQLGQELLQLFVARKSGRHSIASCHIAAQPEHVVLFRSNGLVLAADKLPQPKDRVDCAWKEWQIQTH
jgi:hypothetical protein